MVLDLPLNATLQQAFRRWIGAPTADPRRRPRAKKGRAAWLHGPEVGAAALRLLTSRDIPLGASRCRLIAVLSAEDI